MADETGLSPLVPAVHSSSKRNKGKGKQQQQYSKMTEKRGDEENMTVVTIDPPSRTQYNFAPTPSNIPLDDANDGDGGGLMKVQVNHGLGDVDLNQMDDNKKDFLKMLDAAAELAAISYANHAMSENAVNKEQTPIEDRLLPPSDAYKGDKRQRVVQWAKQFAADFDDFRKANEVAIEESMPERVMRQFAEFVLSGINIITSRKEEDYSEGYIRQLKDSAMRFIKDSERYLKLRGPTTEQISMGREFIDGIIRLNLVEASTPILFTVRPSDVMVANHVRNHHHPRLRAYIDVKRYGVLVPKIIWKEIESIFYYEASRRIAFLNAMRLSEEDVIDLDCSSMLCHRMALERDTFGYIAAQYNSTAAAAADDVPMTMQHQGSDGSGMDSISNNNMPLSSSDDLEMATTLSNSPTPPPPPNHILPAAIQPFNPSAVADPAVVATIERKFANSTGSDLRSEIVRRALYFFRCYYSNINNSSGDSDTSEALTANLDDYVLLTMRHMDPFIKLDKLSQAASSSPTRTEPHMPRESFVIQSDSHHMHRMSAILYHALAVYCVMDLECERITGMNTWSSSFGEIPEKYKLSMESKILDDIGLANEERCVKAVSENDAMIAFHALLEMPREYWIVAVQTKVVCDIDGQYWFNVVYEDGANEMTIKKGLKRRTLSEATSWVVLEGTWHYLSTLIK